MTSWVTGFALAGCALLSVAGCEVETHKSGNGDDVKVATPFGGLHVKTDGAEVQNSTGLSAYPGAQPVRKEKDNGSADVNMSLGDFHLRVVAMGYRTDDSPQKVEAFYRDGLKRFGDVIACRNYEPIGIPTRTSQGLTCDDMKENHVTVQNHPAQGELELKAGSKQHQHMVAIDSVGTGTKFGLVALDLPGKFFSDDEHDDGRQ